MNKILNLTLNTHNKQSESFISAKIKVLKLSYLLPFSLFLVL